jgi:4-hydroxy-tetrahydrodipicolinate synthase
MELSGLFVPLVTPFDEAGQVALPALEALAYEVLDAGADGLVALGTTGEPSALTSAERLAVVGTVGPVARRRRVPLLVGASSPDALSALADRPEVTAALSVVPPFVRPGEAGVLAHFRALAASSPKPLVVYDVPARTGQQLSAPALAELAAVPGIAGVKHAPGSITAGTMALLADPPTGFSLLGGDDVFISPLLALGAHGAIVASAHCATTDFAALLTAWRTGDLPTGRALGARLSRLSAALFAEPNPTVIKAVLHAERRIPTPDVRLPLLAARPSSVAAARELIAGAPMTAYR